MQDFMTFEVKESENKKRLFECKDSKSPSGHSLFVKLEATHSGIVNGNARFYRPDRMQDCTHTWTPKGKPERPVLYNHKRDGECFGRVKKARYVDLSYQYNGDFPGVRNLCFYDSTPKKLNVYNSVDWVLRNLHGKPDYKGLGYIELDTNIVDPEAIKKVQDERFLTVSVAFGTDAAVCSICHTDWAAEDRCDHDLGQMVDGRPMFLISGNFIYKECSFVNFPADPWGKVTSIDSIRNIADSVANRVFFMGLSRSEQQKRLVLEGTDSLIDAGDAINFLGSDIQPMDDFEEEETDMDLKAIQAEIKSKDLTKDRALALRTELEAAEDKAAVKRTLTSLVAKIRANDWADAVTTKETVEARIAGLDSHLETLPEADRAAYLDTLEADAESFGIEFKRKEPVTDPPSAPAETDGVVNPEAATGGVVIDPLILAAIDKELEGKDESKYPHKDALLKTVEGIQTFHGSLNDEEKYLLRSAISSLLEVFYAENYLAYAKQRISSAGDAVLPQTELDELHTAIEKGEMALKVAETDKQALLTTNRGLIASQKRTIAQAIIVGSSLLNKKGFTGLTADQIQEEISERSKRGLNSLEDSLQDLLKEIPGANVQAASESKPTEGAVRQVSDNAKVTETDDHKEGSDTTQVAEEDGEKPVAPIARIFGARAANRMQAKAKFRARIANIDKEK